MVEQLRIRRSIQVMWQEYLQGNEKPFMELIRAWHGIQKLSKTDPGNEHSFFKIGGFHGEPFRGAGYGNAAWWGGWCNHGNVLFPTWHRAYCMRIENALRSIPGCGDVTLLFWDETGEETKGHGVPAIFHQEKFFLDGKTIDNPLYSFEFPQTITDHVDPDFLYTKASGYETVRYPYSGRHNRHCCTQCEDLFGQSGGEPQLQCEKLADFEIEVTEKDAKGKAVKKLIPTGTPRKSEECLKEPNFTVFSNTTSAMQWNDSHELAEHVMPLESHHNDMHLAAGGFDVPGQGDD
ncbi:Tyrosinase [Lachnellula suecica]|uniref:tyrosinase n=1 Tax=Lachnellula suecica TaxID=602035 RepID=A0A8T9C214_9HELO|nr:Tyrosinase [Lachnellula suecica]